MTISQACSRVLFVLLLAAGCGADPSSDEDSTGGAGGKADDASAWSHLRVVSADETKVDVDFITNYWDDNSYKPTNLYVADPVYINVRAEGLQGTESVRAVLLSWEGLEASMTYASYRYELDLTWQGDHFSGDLRDAKVFRGSMQVVEGKDLVIRAEGYGGNFSSRQELAVVVDGRWLVDPVSGQSNFRLDMFAASR